MLGRFIGLETLAVFVALFATGAAVATVAGAPGWAVASTGAAAAVIFVLPASVWVQEYLVALWVDRGRYDKALDLAARILETAPGKKHKDRARADLGLIHVARGDHARAREHLERAAAAPLRSLAKAVVQGHLALCLAHLGEELERAAELAAKARREVPEDDAPLFDYFVAVVAWKRGEVAEARRLVEASLAADAEDKDPAPGERRCVRGQRALAAGDAAAARAAFEAAARVEPVGPFVERARAELAKP